MIITPLRDPKLELRFENPRSVSWVNIDEATITSPQAKEGAFEPDDVLSGFSDCGLIPSNKEFLSGESFAHLIKKSIGLFRELRQNIRVGVGVQNVRWHLVASPSTKNFLHQDESIAGKLALIDSYAILLKLATDRVRFLQESNLAGFGDIGEEHGPESLVVDALDVTTFGVEFAPCGGKAIADDRIVPLPRHGAFDRWKDKGFTSR
ncbi:uncharacterized protein N7483_011747 [Penicillium malachiteum]|uniref:uncharacterized protein n=1 Tax=Penicillium malachiteum TaxID=1324776 RepID=UPI002547ABCB|nr:uncharacterized protein N7483_011747 [Penicillium malachiteum]KAJ5714566.1 hypothetical protein N7483_011747 [Penicillium malachiteum]